MSQRFPDAFPVTELIDVVGFADHIPERVMCSCVEEQ